MGVVGLLLPLWLTPTPVCQAPGPVVMQNGPVLETPAPVLDLPPPPTRPVRRDLPLPRAERIGATLRLRVQWPWLIGQALVGGRVSDPAQFSFGAALRLGLPVLLYGDGDGGFGVVPTGSLVHLRSLPDHATAGLALASLKNVDHHHHSPSGFALLAEAAIPFSGGRVGLSSSLVAFTKGFFGGATYLLLPGPDEGASHTVLLSLGLNLQGLLH